MGILWHDNLLVDAKSTETSLNNLLVSMGISWYGNLLALFYYQEVVASPDHNKADQ